MTPDVVMRKGRKLEKGPPAPGSKAQATGPHRRRGRSTEARIDLKPSSPVPTCGHPQGSHSRGPNLCPSLLPHSSLSNLSLLLYVQNHSLASAMHIALPSSSPSESRSLPASANCGHAFVSSDLEPRR